MKIGVNRMISAAAKAVGAERVDIVLAGGIRDDVAAGELVRTGKEHAGAVLDLDDGSGIVIFISKAVSIKSVESKTLVSIVEFSLCVIGGGQTSDGAFRGLPIRIG